jgi:hypothetical protein
MSVISKCECESCRHPFEVVGEHNFNNFVKCPKCKNETYVPFPEGYNKSESINCEPAILPSSIPKPSREPVVFKENPLEFNPVRTMGCLSISFIAVFICVFLIWAWHVFEPKIASSGKAEQQKNMRQVEVDAKESIRRIEKDVAEDAVKQYEIAKRNGDAIAAYSAASYVCAAYLQANDEANYARWKKIEEEEGRRAGLSR